MPETLFELRFGLTVAVLLGITLVSVPVARVWNRSRLERTIGDLCEGLAHHLGAHFMIQPCFRCYESQWEFLRASQRGRSVECRCVCCGRKQWAPAATPEADRILEMLGSLEESQDRYRRLSSENPDRPVVLVVGPDAPLPFEKTVRLHIPESVSAQVWRRDGGVCVGCESKQNLQFDHVIPVSRGGATSVANLQLLCQACNASKGTRI